MFRHGIADMRDMVEGDVRFAAALRDGGLSDVRVPMSWLREHVAHARPTTTAREVADAPRSGPASRSSGSSGSARTCPASSWGGSTAITEPHQAARSRSGTARSTSAVAASRRGIVCGATNFAVGDLVPAALPGATLPGGFAIGARKTYGHVSRRHDLPRPPSSASATTTTASWCSPATRPRAPTW